MTFPKPRSALLVLSLLLSSSTTGDDCRIQGESAVRKLKERLDGVDMLVSVCPHCQNTEPVPLRVRDYELLHTAPDSVRLVFYDLTFPLSALEEAERTRQGPLAQALQAQIEKEYEDETGYLPNDPYLVQEKRDVFQMHLKFAREDVEMRTWDELSINAEKTNAALIYYPVGNDRYRSLGAEIGCDTYSNAPLEVTFTPVNRDPALVSPPWIYIADVTNQCYDGSCPRDEWVVLRATDYFDEPDGQVQGMLSVDEILKPLQTLSYVRGGKALAGHDHGRIFENDIFYLLDSLGEGFHRFWHYGEVFVADASDVRSPEGWNYCDRKNTCWAELEDYPDSAWWSKVRRGGEVVWVKDPIGSISGVLVD